MSMYMINYNGNLKIHPKAKTFRKQLEEIGCEHEKKVSVSPTGIIRKRCRKCNLRITIL